MESFQNSVAIHSVATLLISMRTVSLASNQDWLCVDADAWCKRVFNCSLAIFFPIRSYQVFLAIDTAYNSLHTFTMLQKVSKLYRIPYSMYNSYSGHEHRVETVHKALILFYHKTFNSAQYYTIIDIFRVVYNKIHLSHWLELCEWDTTLGKGLFYNTPRQKHVMVLFLFWNRVKMHHPFQPMIFLLSSWTKDK